MIPVAILCGGKGTRLRPLTDRIPKSLVTVAGKPFIHHQFALLKREGVTDVVVCVGHLGEQVIAAAVEEGNRFGINVRYSSDDGLGTGGALRKALPLLGNTFFVLYGDSYLDTPYSHILSCFEQVKRKGLMTLSPDGVDYGLNILTAEPVAARWGKFDLSVVYNLLWAAGDLHEYRMGQRFYEIGSFKGLAETDALIRGKTRASTHTETYFRDAAAIAQSIDLGAIEEMVNILATTRSWGGRLFILGVGGSAANASHAVNDFRKLCDIEAYAPTDNVAELTARTNDDGWASVFARWLEGSRICEQDTVLVFSVGGGNVEKGVSANIVAALKVAKIAGAKIIGIVGRDGGYTAKVADACVIVPTLNPATVTPHTEAFHAVVWHALVTHPKLLANAMKWAS